LVLPRRVWDYIRSLGSEGSAYAEIRGWRFDYVAPRYRYRPSVSEIASYCPSRRDIYLRRVAGLRVERSSQASYGTLVHEFFLEPFRLVDRGVTDVEELAAARRQLARRLNTRPDKFLLKVYSLGAALALQAMIEGGVPVRVEPEVPGAPVGLSDMVKPDLLVGFIPVEVTTTDPRSTYGERKELQLAGYALAIEAWTGFPVDYGVTVYIRRRNNTHPLPEWHVIPIDDSLRRSFLRARDEIAMIVENNVDPGPASEGCPSWCPFRNTAPGCPGTARGLERR